MKKLILISTILLLSFQIAFGQKETKTLDNPENIPLIFESKPKVVSMPKPHFPGGTHVSGTVFVIVTINEEGNVIDVKAISGHSLLRQPAEKAALQAKFQSYLTNGKAVKVKFSIAYNFTREYIPELKISREESQTSKRPTRILPCSILTGKTIKLFKPQFLTNYQCKFCKNKNLAIVNFTINEKGFVESARASSEHSLLRTASVRAIKKSRFSPSFNCGLAVKTYGRIVYDFVRQNSGWQSRVIKVEYDLKLENN